MKKAFSYSSPVVILALFLSATIFSSCGQQIAPSGGPKDTIPPAFIGSLPPNGTVNFKGNRIVLAFNEFIALDNPFEKMIYSPIPKKNPETNGRLKEITVNIRDTLEKNTTYFIDFRNSIKDINENNVLQKFSFVFSTGPYIDSARLTGNVFIAETGKPDSTLIVVLQQDFDDSAVAKKTPRYYTKLNGKGRFEFRYLKPGKYNLFALKDADGSKKYDQVGEMIGFLDKPVLIGLDTAFNIFAFGDSIVPKSKPAAKTTTTEEKKTTEKTNTKSLSFTNSLLTEKQDLLSDFKLIANNPIKQFDTTKIRLVDENFKSIPKYGISIDSTNKIFSFNTIWKENATYKLIIEKDFATDTAGLKYLKTDTTTFTTKKEAEYGSLAFKITNFDSTLQPIILLKQAGNIIFKKELEKENQKIKLMPPGDYDIEILFDLNKNGKWDTGNYWKKLQPERIIPRNQKLNIKPNVENEIAVDLIEIQKIDPQ
jgi:uncharacterized protein (DUF2141 family)